MIISYFDTETGKEKKVPANPPIRQLSVVLAKPTKACNADCSYCFAKPYDKDRWSIDTFKRYFDTLEPYLKGPVQWIWHGGEPMLMGVDFYKEAEAYARTKNINIVFSMQSNLTLLKGDRWLSYIKNDINGRISTSYDIDEVSRTIGEDSEKYNQRFKSALDTLMDNKLSPFVIGVFDDVNINGIFDMYKFSRDYQDRYGVGLDFRVNPKVEKTGVNFDSAFLLNPVVYGQKMVELLDEWLFDDSTFVVTPLDAFINFYFNVGENTTCPWTNKCAGSFISIEPNGDVYNCDDIVHYMGNEMKQGNLNTHTMEEVFASEALQKLTRRMSEIDPDCVTCDFYYACRGGCGALTSLNQKIGNARYPYCATNKIIFKRIREYDQQGYSELLKKKANAR